MEHAEISIHQVRVFLCLKGSKRWLTASEVADKAKVGGRTARLHLKRFVDLGMVDQAEVFPGHRYRLAKKLTNAGTAALDRLTSAVEVFGMAGPVR